MREGYETEHPSDPKIIGSVGRGKVGRMNAILGVIVAVVVFGCIGLFVAWFGAGGKKTDSATNEESSAANVASAGSGIAKPSPAKRLDSSLDQTSDVPLTPDASDPQVNSDVQDAGESPGTNAEAGSGTRSPNDIGAEFDGATTAMPGAMPAVGGGWQFHADRKGVRNGCKSGMLRLTPSRLTFSCEGDSSKDVDVTLDSTVRVDGDGIRTTSGEKYHFVVKAQNDGKMADQRDESTESLFREWTAGRLPAAPSAPVEQE